MSQAGDSKEGAPVYGSRSERVVLGAALLTLVLAFASWVQMRLGTYSLDKALVATAACSGVLFLAVRSAFGAGSPRPESRHAALLAGLVVVGFGVLYAAYPTYFLLGGQDPGPYLAFAARIAKTGGLDLFVPELQRWAQSHGDLARTFPAVYGDLSAPAASHALHPQFVHLFTAYVANFWALAGVEGAVRANAWLAVLCLGLGFVVVRRLGSVGAAFALVVALGVNPAFVWASRITLTEMLALLINLTGVALLLLAWDLESLAAGTLGGAVLGLGVLNRLDGGLGALAIAGFAAAALLEAGPRRRIATRCALVHLGMTSFGYFDGHRLAPEYWRDLDRDSGSAMTRLVGLTSALDLGALALALLPARLTQEWRLNETRLRFAAYATLAATAVWVGYGLTLRPLGDNAESGKSMLELTWYTSWIAWPLALAGLALALGHRTFQRWLPLWLLTVGPLVAFTAQTEVTHVHIWASRRWVPQVIPFMLAFAAYGASRLATALGSRPRMLGAGAVFAVPFLVSSLGFARPFLFESMLRGVPAAYEKVAEYARKDPSRWPLLTNSVIVGSILTYVYDVPTVLLNDRGSAAAANGELAGALGVGFDPFGLHALSAVDARVAGRYLENTVTRPPSQVVDLHIPLEAGEFGPSAFDLQIPAAHLALRTRGTQRTEQGALVATAKRNAILWGPWIDLPAGRYRAEWYGSVGPGRHKRRGTLDVIFDKGTQTIAKMPLEEVPVNRGERLLGGLDFVLPEPTPGVEFRVRVTANSAVTLARLRLQRFAP